MNRPDAPSLSKLFLEFSKASISGFGGVLPFARRMLVEKNDWLTEAEFADLFSFCQFIPGANIVNLSVCVGARFHGPIGAFVTLMGMLVPPTLVILLLGSFYVQFHGSPVMQGIFHGLGAAAAGLVVATALKMGRGIRDAGQYLFAALAFLSIVWLSVPLFTMLVVLAPLSIAYQWMRRK